jgi:hypothetical protein
MKNKNNNNAVYILMGNGGWENDDVLGVYDSKAKARAAAKKYDAAVKDDVKNENYDLAEYEGYYIIEKVVNKAANDECVLRTAEGNEEVTI